MQLATFVHISDLHFGDIDPTTKNAVAPPYWAKMGEPFDGLLGHSYRSLVRLEQFVANLKKTEETEVRLIVTGDLTTWAASSQFDLASTFLSRDLRPPKHVYQYIGLHEPDWLSL